MIKYCLDKWNENSGFLETAIVARGAVMYEVDYIDLVKMVVEHILNRGESRRLWNVNYIREIADGGYQGVFLYTIPPDTYMPMPGDYLMTFVEYGSCSGCDTLQSMQAEMDGNSLTEEHIKDFMTICKDIITNTIQPFNNGWRGAENFEQVIYE